jgi:hypothetical protein
VLEIVVWNGEVQDYGGRSPRVVAARATEMTLSVPTLRHVIAKRFVPYRRPHFSRLEAKSVYAICYQDFSPAPGEEFALRWHFEFSRDGTCWVPFQEYPQVFDISANYYGIRYWTLSGISRTPDDGRSTESPVSRRVVPRRASSYICIVSHQRFPPPNRPDTGQSASSRLRENH